MTLNIPPVPSIFTHQQVFNTGLRAGQTSVTVAQDGTGDTDDIQEAVNLISSSGGIVFIKEGTYQVDLQFTPENSGIKISTDNTTLIGVGAATIIKTDGTNINAIRSTANNLVFRDIKFDGNTSTQKAMWMTGTNIVVSHCFFTDWGNSLLMGGEHCIVSSCEFDDGGTCIATDGNFCSITGNIFKDGGTAITGGLGDGCSITGNIIEGNTTARALSMPGVDQWTVTGNVIYDNSGIGIDNNGGDNCTITGNTIYSNGSDGIRNTGARNTISNNACFENTGDGIDVGTSDNNVISGNVCRDNGAYGITVSNVTADKNILIGNVCLGNTTGQINDSGTNTHPNGASGTNNLALDDLNIIA